MCITIELSTVCFSHDKPSKKIERCRTAVESNGFKFGIQLHNSVTKDLYHQIKDINVPFTVHAPVFSEYFINLAINDFDTIITNFQNTVNIMQGLNSTIVIFHGFFMTERPIKNDPASYAMVLREAIDNKYRLRDTRVMDPKYLETAEYQKYQNTVKKNMDSLRNYFPAYTICMENDFPGIGNGNQTPEHLKFLDCPIWLDTGHLWASAILHKFDFYAALDMICQQCQVAGVHLNTNRTPLSWDFQPPDGDTHSHLSNGYDMDMKSTVRILKQNKIPHFTIEVIGADIDDINFLINTY